MTERLTLRATLSGHAGWVTAISAPQDATSKTILSASRDKSIMVWEIEEGNEDYAVAKRSLHGHSHFVQDVVGSADGMFCLSASWDGTLRLWDLKTGQTTRRFVDHTKDVLSVAFSSNNRQIVSGSRDKTLKIWNTLGECKATFGETERGHSNWVSCVRFSPTANNVIVSGGWDNMVKVWSFDEAKKLFDLAGHTGYVNTVTISPDASLCASGGKEGVTILWDLTQGSRLYNLDAGNIIHALCFSPNRYWLVAATQSSIRIWDLESKKVVDELKPEFNLGPKAQVPYCVSLSWSADGSTLYSGYTDGKIRVWTITTTGF